jgi:hypothetical protein
MTWNATPRGQRYRLTGHAERQQRRRNVGRRDVEQVLDHHDVSHPDQKGNQCLTGYVSGGRRLRVVVASEADGLAVITVIILR